MPLRLMSDAGAQSTSSGAITAVQTTITLQSSTSFASPAAGQQASAIILDAGNPAFNASTPLATPFEYIYYTSNSANVLGGITRGVAGTTAKAFFAGATVAQTLLVEDIYASTPWKYDEQNPSGVASVTIPASGTIPGSYLGIPWHHIEIQWYGRSTSGNTADVLNMTFNGDTAGHYDWESVTFTNTTVLVPAANNGALRIGVVPGGAASSVLFNSGYVDIQNYSVATIRRAFQAQLFRNDSVIGLEIDAGAWQNITNPITSITIAPAAGNWAAGSIVSTYLKP